MQIKIVLSLQNFFLQVLSFKILTYFGRITKNSELFFYFKTRRNSYLKKKKLINPLFT